MRWRGLLPWLLAVVVAGCGRAEPTGTGILLFNGRGTSPSDVAAIEDLLR